VGGLPPGLTTRHTHAEVTGQPRTDHPVEERVLVGPPEVVPRRVLLQVLAHPDRQSQHARGYLRGLHGARQLAAHDRRDLLRTHPLAEVPRLLAPERRQAAPGGVHLSILVLRLTVAGDDDPGGTVHVAHAANLCRRVPRWDMRIY